jgi:hypothetical protein
LHKDPFKYKKFIQPKSQNIYINPSLFEGKKKYPLQENDILKFGLTSFVVKEINYSAASKKKRKDLITCPSHEADSSSV